MRFPAVMAGKGASALSRALNLGEGQTFPGLVAERLHPSIMGDLASTLPDGVVVVTGTNGKTTTTKLLSEMLTRHGSSVLTNDSGSNLRRGITSALVASASISGSRLRNDVAVLEVDEASMPAVMAGVKPSLVVVNNLLRDQLDRHGDLDALADIVAASIAAIPGVTALLNADDPLVAGIGRRLPGRVLYYGLDDERLAANRDGGSASAAPCPACGTTVEFTTRHYAHLGDWRCPECGQQRPPLDFAARDVRTLTDASMFDLVDHEGRTRLHLGVAGVHNIYNAVAAGATAMLCGVAPDEVAATTLRFRPPFGRSESFMVDGQRVVLLLAKNPSGADQALAPILTVGAAHTVALMINDNPADGRDISWIWDVGLDGLDLSSCTFVASGTRAEDAALRLKYAGARPGSVHVAPEPCDAVRALVQLTPQGTTAHIVATYTAMLAVRRCLAGSNDRLTRLGRSFGLA